MPKEVEICSCPLHVFDVNLIFGFTLFFYKKYENSNDVIPMQ